MNPFRTTTLIAVLIFLPALAVAQCESETDEFTGQVTVACENREVPVESQPGERIYGAYATAAKSEGKYAVLLTTSSDSWNFLSTDKAHALIDGDRFEFRAGAGDREIESGGVVEQKVILLSESEVRTVAEAERFRLKLGQAVFDLSSITDDFATIISRY